MAEHLTRSIMAPRVQRIRRLVIAEAARFPELGAAYWDRAFRRGVLSIAECLRALDARGLLTVPDPVLAAQHLAGLLLWTPVNQVMFTGSTEAVRDEELRHYIDSGTAVFLAAYAPRAMPSR